MLLIFFNILSILNRFLLDLVTIATKQLLASNSEFAEIPESVKHFPAIPPEVSVGSCFEEF